MVVYPHGVHPLFVGTTSSIKALDSAMVDEKQILLVAKKDAEVETPERKDLFEVGTVATILQLLKLPDGTVKVLVEGGQRAHIDNLVADEEFMRADVSVIEEPQADAREAEALVRTVMKQFEQYVKVSKKVPQEVLSSLSSIDDPARLVDTIAAQISLNIDDKQSILDAFELKERMEILLGFMDTEIDVSHMEKRIRGRVKKQMEKSQREYYLNEQMKAIQKELGDLEEAPNEFEELKTKIEDGGMSKEAKDKALAELNKLKLMSPMSAEATVVRGYLDWMLSIPWKKRSRVRKDLATAQKILDEDHYGLEEVKDRIIEYLASKTRSNCDLPDGFLPRLD